MNRYQDKTALVTGGSSGIGLALAEQLAGLGAHVWILARDPKRIDAAVERVKAARRTSSQDICAILGDVSDAGRITQTLCDFIRGKGAPDYLFNSAGICHPGHFEELDLDIFRQMIEVNYLGTVYVTKAVTPEMIRRGSGHIINISSVAGFLGVYGYSAYGPSKFAVRGFSDVLRSELRHQGIKVSVVFPPDTQTPQLEYENQFKPEVLKILDESNKVMSPEAVAKIILRDAARGYYTITPGFDSSIMYHLNNLLGNLSYRVMDWMVLQSRRKASRSKNNSSH